MERTAEFLGVAAHDGMLVLLLAPVLLMLISGGALIYFAYRRSAASRRQPLSAERCIESSATVDLAQRCAELQQDIRGFASTSLGMGERIEALAEELRAMMIRIERLEQQHSETGHYTNAVRLAARGGSVDDLINSFDLTPLEAELLCKLHRDSPPTGVATPPAERH